MLHDKEYLQKELEKVNATLATGYHNGKPLITKQLIQYRHLKEGLEVKLKALENAAIKRKS